MFPQSRPSDGRVRFDGGGPWGCAYIGCQVAWTTTNVDGLVTTTDQMAGIRHPLSWFHYPWHSSGSQNCAPCYPHIYGVALTLTEDNRKIPGATTIDLEDALAIARALGAS